MKLGKKSIVIALLFVCLVLVNYLATTLPLRFDATAENIYTLSSGSQAILKKIEEPITLDLYFSRSAAGIPITYKNFAARVEEMLRQYERSAKGKIRLNVIDPRPDTPEEEQASAVGLQPQQIDTGDQLTFGLVATQADQQKTIGSFNIQREAFLEYDISQLIYSVQQIDKRKLGLISSLPLRAPMDYMAMQSGRMPQNQYVLGEWEKTYEVVSIEPGAKEIPAGIDVLAVIHPQNLSPNLQYAIDQFLLSGKSVFMALDPSSQHFKRQGGQMAMMGGQQPNVSSDLPQLLKAYGVGYRPDLIVGDPVNAAKIRGGNGAIINYPIYLSLGKKDLNSKSMTTAQLQSLVLIEAGSLSAVETPGLNFTPLIESSAQAGDLQAMAIQFAQPEDLANQIKASGKKTLAAVVTGKFKTAFPDGAPKDEKPAAKDPSKPEVKTEAPAKEAAPSLKESKGASMLIVVADTDWLLDDYSVRRMNVLGVQAAQPLNDNLYLAQNVVEFLSGSQDLVSIRGKGNSVRPFTVVNNIQAKAQQQYQAQLQRVESKLQEVRARLTEIQSKRGDTRTLVASPEVQKALEEYQRQELDARRERRAIRRSLREDIDALENMLLVVNLLLSPILIGFVGYRFYRSRHAQA